MPLLLGWVPWAEVSGIGTASWGALETPVEERGAERALPNSLLGQD